jgi:V8-like Glu-specific endopeptidase
MLSVTPFLIESIEESFWVDYNSAKVEPAMLKDRNVATTFQLNYKDRQYTVTNLHVCRLPLRNNPSLTDNQLIGMDIKVGAYQREILAVDKFHDLCLLESNPNLSAFHLAESYEMGELVRIIGYPRGLEKTIRKGRLITKTSEYIDWINRYAELIQISTIGYGGNSGSAVLNKWGEVAGVVFAGDKFHTEMYIVPLDDLRNFMERSR